MNYKHVVLALISGFVIGGGSVCFFRSGAENKEIKIEQTRKKSNKKSTDKICDDKSMTKTTDLENKQEQQDVLQQAQSHVDAMYTYTNIKARQESLKTFMYDDRVADKLLEYEGVGDNTININSEVIKQVNYLRKIEEGSWTVLSRIKIRFNKNKGTDQYLMNVTHFRQNEDGKWLVKDSLTMDDSMKDQFYY